MIPQWLNWVDVAFVIAVVLFAWGGYQKGFAAQVAHILTFLFLGILLFFAYPYLHNFFRARININETFIMWVVVAVLIGLSVVTFILISKLLVTMLKAHVTESTDQVFGLVLGTLRGALGALLCMVLLVMLGPSGVKEIIIYDSNVGKHVVVRLVRFTDRNSGLVRRGIEKTRQRLEAEKEANERDRYGEY